MDPEERKMLEKLLQISEHTNRIVRHMRREVLLGRFIHIMYWLIILGIGFGIYYYIKPYIGNLDAVTNVIQQYRQ